MIDSAVRDRAVDDPTSPDGFLRVRVVHATTETCRIDGTVVDATGRFRGQVLTRDSLRGLPAATTELYLRDNGFRDLPAGVFDHLPNLRVLDLGFNRLDRLDAGVFAGLTKLEELDLNFNEIGYLAEGVFADLTNLLALSLHHNRLNENTPFGITSFAPPDHSTGPFDNLVNLRLLDLGTNPLHRLPPRLLDNLVNLEMINLYLCQLEDLDPATFAGTRNLRGLVLAENPFTVPFPEDLLPHGAKLEAVYCPFNAFHDLPPGVFAGCTHPDFLGPMKLTGARFVTTDAPPWLAPTAPTVGDLASLAGLPADTREISLRGLRLSALPAGVFDRFTRLESLDLSFNDLTALPDGVFDSLANLTRLQISHTGLRELPSGVFSGTANLRELRLNSNRLRRLPAGVFAGLTRLEVLNLDQNPLSLASFGAPETAFTGLTALTELSMNWVYLPELPAGWFDELTNLEILNLYRNHTRAVPAGLLDRLPRLRVCDIMGNQLTELPAGLFDHNPELQLIWLLDNRFPNRAAIDGALTDEVRARVAGFSTWGNPGWHTPPMFATRELRFGDPFRTKCED